MKTNMVKRTKILFVCHGNICRSPMAEFIMKSMVASRGIADKYEIASAATSTEEIGNDIYPPAKRTLTRHGIAFSKRGARQMTAADYYYYDIIFIMDQNNKRWMRYIMPDDVLRDEAFGEKVRLLMSLCGESRDVADPWYYGQENEKYMGMDVVYAA
ncbi:MAG: low molecular weight protein-tyrosine-phosphatase [Prevotella sp.]